MSQHGLSFHNCPADFGRTAGDYAAHRQGFPEELFERLQRYGVGLAGQRVLDLGTGTGTLARGFARRGGVVTGLDIAGPMLAEAARLDAVAGVQVRYVMANAEETGLPVGSFDVVTAGQCWHWFRRDEAAREAMRLLAPGGALAICHFDWLPLPGSVVEASEQLILRYNPSWRGAGGTGVYPLWPGDAAAAGFTNIETFTFDPPTFYTHEAWRGRIRASAGIAATLSPEEVAAFDVEHAALLREHFPSDPLETPHRVFALIAHRPGGDAR